MYICRRQLPISCQKSTNNPGKKQLIVLNFVPISCTNSPFKYLHLPRSELLCLLDIITLCLGPFHYCLHSFPTKDLNPEKLKPPENGFNIRVFYHYSLLFYVTLVSCSLQVLSPIRLVQLQLAALTFTHLCFNTVFKLKGKECKAEN